MTTEDDFQAMLDAHPDDHGTRAVFADWLQDRDDPRAEGYRALAMQERYPFGSKHGGSRWWHRGTTYRNSLPLDWFACLPRLGEGREYVLWPHCEGQTADSRRDVEDAAALAFAQLPAARRAELLKPAG